MRAIHFVELIVDFVYRLWTQRSIIIIHMQYATTQRFELKLINLLHSDYLITLHKISFTEEISQRILFVSLNDMI